MAARQTHNLKVVGSNPTPGTENSCNRIVSQITIRIAEVFVLPHGRSTNNEPAGVKPCGFIAVPDLRSSGVIITHHRFSACSFFRFSPKKVARIQSTGMGKMPGGGYATDGRLYRSPVRTNSRSEDCERYLTKAALPLGVPQATGWYLIQQAPYVLGQQAPEGIENQSCR